MKTLVFVHGFMGGSTQWAEQVEAFGKRYNVVTVDLPGFGANNALPAPDRMCTFAEFVFDKLTADGIEHFHLLGHSMGGMIVQEMMTIAPERVEQLVLYGTGASGVLPDRFETIAESKRRAEADGPNATARRISATWFRERENASAYPACAAIAQCSSAQSINAGLEAMQAWSRVEALPKISVPTLVLWGDNDRTYSWQQTEELWTTIPNARLAVVPGCAHAVHLEKPAIFNALVDDFLT